MLLVVPKLDKLIQNRDSWIENGMSVEKSLGLDQTLIKKLLFFQYIIWHWFQHCVWLSG